MKTYQGSEIRNVAVMGHAHCGKTTLIAALLHAAKMTPTQGRVAEGTAPTAYDEEEVARGMTMQNAVPKLAAVAAVAVLAYLPGAGIDRKSVV